MLAVGLHRSNSYCPDKRYALAGPLDTELEPDNVVLPQGLC